MHEKILKKAGLTDVQAEVYSFLLENGEFKASEIAKKTKRPRGVVYKGLDDLLLLKLIQKIENKGITRFKADHPGNLERILEAKEKQAIREINDKKNRLETDKETVLSTLPDLVSVFNLTNDKPGIKFYEGEEGLRKVLDDTLKSKTEIYLLLNKEALKEEDAFRDINEKYKIKREKLGINKKIIRVGQKPFQEPILGQEYEKITEIKYFEKITSPFKSSIQIYDNKISYQIIDNGKIISIIIEDKNIYEMNKSWFEYLWENSK